MPQIVSGIPPLQPSASHGVGLVHAAPSRFTGCTGPGHSASLARARRVEDMKTKDRHGIRPADLPGSPPGVGPVATPAFPVGPDTFELRLEIVPADQGADPARIPWIDEIRAGNRVEDAFPGII